MFVVDIQPATRTVVIGPREALLGRGVEARELNWLVDPPAVGQQVSVQIRHRSRPVPATILTRSDDSVELALAEPASAITPGQSLVLYDGDCVLGGGVIERAHRGEVTGPPARRGSLPILAA
jgi:tRNA-specific 2-thiouridylase